MIKKRLIFKLLYKHGKFILSRNFNHQVIGDVNWLINNYKFNMVSKYIDELIILDIGTERDQLKFINDYLKLYKVIFIPVSIGGGIDSYEKAKVYFENGADKIVINSAFYQNNNFINDIAKVYGKQSIVFSVDYQIKDSKMQIYLSNGKKKFNGDIYDLFNKNIHNFGEILITDMSRDGTGIGVNFEILEHINKFPKKPTVISGGIGNFKHILEVLKNENNFNAVATGNLLNFIGDGFKNTRKELLNSGINIPNFEC